MKYIIKSYKLLCLFYRIKIKITFIRIPLHTMKHYILIQTHSSFINQFKYTLIQLFICK